MATNFGKLNFPVSFNPQTAFPLDARSYFESLNEAIAAAATAAPAGDTNTTYYFGQTIVVVNLDNLDAMLYIIIKDEVTGKGALKAVGQNAMSEDDLLIMLKAMLVDDQGIGLLNENGKVQLKTINGQSLLGSGNITISSSGNITIDAELNVNSDNPIANKAVSSAIFGLQKKYRIVENDNEFSNLTDLHPGDKVYVKSTDMLWLRTSKNAWKRILDSDNDFIDFILNELNFKTMFDETHFQLENNKITLKVADTVTDGSKNLVSSDAVFDHVDNIVGKIEDILSDI